MFALDFVIVFVIVFVFVFVIVSVIVLYHQSWASTFFERSRISASSLSLVVLASFATLVKFEHRWYKSSVSAWNLQVEHSFESSFFHLHWLHFLPYRIHGKFKNWVNFWKINRFGDFSLTMYIANFFHKWRLSLTMKRHKKNIARVQNCPDITILNFLVVSLSFCLYVPSLHYGEVAMGSWK